MIKAKNMPTIPINDVEAPTEIELNEAKLAEKMLPPIAVRIHMTEVMIGPKVLSAWETRISVETEFIRMCMKFAWRNAAVINLHS